MLDLTQHLSRLTEEQRAAVLAPVDRPILVNAGAGSGKTQVLVVRASHLISLGFKPSALVLTSFTKAAAQEIVARVTAIIGQEASEIWAGTIHSVCFRILRQEMRGCEVLADHDYTLLLKKCTEAALESSGIPPKDQAFIGWRFWAAWVDWAKTNGLHPGQAKEAIYKRMEASRPQNPTNYLLAELADEIYQRYEETKARRIDFTDMLVRTRDLLRKPAVAERWQARVGYVLVDEVQDTSTLQNEILTVLSRGRTLFAVGDADQAIYQFRAATPHENIYAFLQRYPDGKVYPITLNWRSTPQILSVANAVIGNNYTADNAQYRKELHPRAGDWSGASEVRHRAFPDDDAEAASVAEEIALEVGVGLRSPRDYFVLTRTNAQSQPFEAELVSRKIPVVAKGGSFFNRKAVQDTTAYVDLALNPHDNVAFLRTYDIPSPDFGKTTRYLGRAFVTSLQNVGAGSLWEAMERLHSTMPGYQRRGVDDLREYIARLRQAALETGPSQILSRVGADYVAYLQKREGEDEEATETIERLLRVAERFSSWEDFRKYMEFVRGLVGEGGSSTSVEAVVLSTVHGAKGLERPVVYAAGMSEGVFPHWLSTGDAVMMLNAEGEPVQRSRERTGPAVYDGTVADERCAAFVVLTRAKSVLRVSSSEVIGRKVHLAPSRFLVEAGLVLAETTKEAAIA